jgi:hypothetical protein
VQLGNPRQVTAGDAQVLKERVLKDLKDRLMDKALLIQQQFDAEQADLTRRNEAYERNKVGSTQHNTSHTHTRKHTHPLPSPHHSNPLRARRSRIMSRRAMMLSSASGFSRR